MGLSKKKEKKDQDQKPRKQVRGNTTQATSLAQPRAEDALAKHAGLCSWYCYLPDVEGSSYHGLVPLGVP